MGIYNGKDLTSIAEQILASKIEYQKDSFFEALYDFGSSSALASALAGTNDKKSKAYKTALRKINFYKRGERNPSAKTQKQILSAMQKNSKTKSRHLQDIGELTISIEGIWRKSQDVRQRRIVHKMDAKSAQQFLSELLKGESAGMDFLMFDYGVDDASFDNYSVTISEL